MPNRMLKETINDSDGLSDCSFFAIDLYKRLITYADDYGRFNADTEIMRARLYARDISVVTEEDIINALYELVGVGKIQFYTAKIFSDCGGKKGIYGVFPHWGNHQRLRETKAKCPDPDDTGVNDWYLRRFVPIDLKAEILERDGFKCQICGKFVTTCRDAKRFVRLGSGLYHIDHIVPVNQGGRATLENLRTTCPECNMKRKRRFTFNEIVKETLQSLRQVAASCGKPPQVAEISGLACARAETETETELELEQELEHELVKSEEPKSEILPFETFWFAYPKKKAKSDAQKAFAKLTDDDKVKIMPALERQKKSYDWTKDGGQYVPYPATWLNGHRWEDEVSEAPARGNCSRKPS